MKPKCITYMYHSNQYRIFCAKLHSGCVTFLGSDHGFINETLHFSLSTVAKSKERLAVGSPVTYLAQRVSDDLTRIVRVELTGSTWEVPSEEEMKELLDELRDHKPTCFKIHKRSILAEVKSRRKSMLRVETDQGELEVDLELSIACSFVPMVGDQLVLDCKVQLDESFVDMKGEVVDVESIAAARCKQLIGRVTRVNKAEKFGEIDRMYCFYFDVLDKEYMHPQVGDRVSLEAIESKQQFHYVWRCLKVVLLDAAMPKVETIDRTMRFDTVPGMVITGNLKVIHADNLTNVSHIGIEQTAFTLILSGTIQRIRRMRAHQNEHPKPNA